MLSTLFSIVSVVLVLASLHYFPARPRWRSVAGVASALCIGVSVYLIPDAHALALDRAIGIIGLSRWRHVGLMIGIFLHAVLVLGLFDTWSPRRVALLIPAAALTILFAAAWFAVRTLHTDVPSTLFYGPLTGRPAAVFAMNMFMGAGLAYLTGFVACEYLLQGLRTRGTFSRVMLPVSTIVTAVIGSTGILSMVEAVWSNLGWDDAGIHAVRTLVTLGVAVVASSSFGFLKLRLSWRSRREARYGEDIPALTMVVRQRSDELHLQHSADYAAVRMTEEGSVTLGLSAEQIRAMVATTAYLTTSVANIDKNEGSAPPHTLHLLHGVGSPLNADKGQVEFEEARRFAAITRLAVEVAPLYAVSEAIRFSRPRWPRGAVRLLVSVLSDLGYPVVPTPPVEDEDTVCAQGDVFALSLRDLRAHMAAAVVFVGNISLTLFPSHASDQQMLAELADLLEASPLSGYHRQVALGTLQHILYMRNTIIGDVGESAWREYAARNPERAAEQDTQIALTMGRYVDHSTYFLADMGRVGIQVLRTLTATGSSRHPSRMAALLISEALHRHGEPCALYPVLATPADEMSDADQTNRYSNALPA